MSCSPGGCPGRSSQLVAGHSANLDGLAVVQRLSEVHDHAGGWEGSCGRHYERPKPVWLLVEIVPAEEEVSCDRLEMFVVPPVAVGRIGQCEREACPERS